jgi:hypothetical protein
MEAQKLRNPTDPDRNTASKVSNFAHDKERNPYMGFNFFAPFIVHKLMSMFT